MCVTANQPASRSFVKTMISFVRRRGSTERISRVQSSKTRQFSIENKFVVNVALSLRDVQLYILYRKKHVCRLTLIPAMGGGCKNTPLQCVFCRKSHSKQWSETAIFYDIVTDSLGFPTQLSVSLYLLPVLHDRFDSNVHVIGFATTSIVCNVRPWS